MNWDELPCLSQKHTAPLVKLSSYWRTCCRHQMETFSALLVICTRNSPVPGEFPANRPVTQSFDVFFDLRPNKRLIKQSWGWWFETPSSSLWRHRNENRNYSKSQQTLIMLRNDHTRQRGETHKSFKNQDDAIKWKHFPRYWPFVRGIHRSPVNSPHKGQWRGALMFSLICVWINGWMNNREAGDLRRYRAHYDVIVVRQPNWKSFDGMRLRINARMSFRFH